MIRCISRWLLKNAMGFEDKATQPWPNKFVIALAPHTSNWDFIIGILFLWSHGQKCHFLMKSWWFFWPMGYLMRSLGGIPVYRSNEQRRRDTSNNQQDTSSRHGMSMTEQLVERAKTMDTFHLCITPEGTRKANRDWRKGFFYIAQEAGIPIIPYGLDFGAHTITSGAPIYPTADTSVDDVMQQLKEFFKGMKGKYPEQFAI